MTVLDSCYVPFVNAISWYEARNKCLRDHGDLAVFRDITQLTGKRFTLDLPYWVGLRNSWWTWSDGGKNLSWQFGKANFYLIQVLTFSDLIQ